MKKELNVQSKWYQKQLRIGATIGADRSRFPQRDPAVRERPLASGDFLKSPCKIC
ncbi:hypothetical protein POHY109586_24095 [Polaromonas hydrogenivorans]